MAITAAVLAIIIERFATGVQNGLMIGLLGGTALERRCTADIALR